LLKRREDALFHVEPEHLAIYERIHRGKPDGKAMAPVRNFACLGCQMGLPPNVVNNLMVGEKLQICQSCSRILYLDEEQP
jgi:hypothetical protein